jgi:hypothetical protein
MIEKICQNINCGKEFNVRLSLNRIKYCSKPCYWEDKKGKNFISNEGIIKLRKLAIEQHLGGFRGRGKDNPFYGKKHTTESLNKIKNSFYHKNHKLDKHPLWQGGISFEPYGLNFNNGFKKIIKIRDNNSCMICHSNNRLNIHHIDYNKLNTIKENCICLCSSCHLKTNFNRSYYTSFFQSLLSKEYGYQYIIKSELIK